MEPGLSPLVVSALANESAAVRRRGRVRVFSSGDGPILAHRLRAELGRQSAVRVIAVGVAGGLDPGLAPGELLVLSEVNDVKGSMPQPLTPARGTHRVGVGVSAPGIVPDPEAKRRLWTQLGSPEAAVVDIESKIYADICADLRVPLTIFKVVSDGADEHVPASVMDAVGRDGSVSQLGVAWRAMFAPRQIPGLARLGRRVAEAAERLADAVETELKGGALPE
ncbi:MAG: hypothetical protein AAF851_16610 [Myxococcota bacterium]